MKGDRPTVDSEDTDELNQPLTIAVDVGNTAAKVMLSGMVEPEDLHRTLSPRRMVDAKQAEDIQSFQLQQVSWVSDLVEWVSERNSCQRQWRIASVNRQAAEQLEQHILSSGFNQVRRIVRNDIPMDIQVDHPDRVGIDRLLGSWAASEIFQVEKNSIERPLVVVDAGSAVTIDLVTPGRTFAGGAILPGLMLQARSLATGTDLLPQIDWSNESAIDAPATNTVDSIRLGVITGVVAAIDRLTSVYTRQFGQEPQLVLTGGDAITIQQHLKTKHSIHPNLVCSGILAC